MEKPLIVRLHIISPVHIGCDEVYEPTSFVIDEKQERLIEFDPMDFIKTLDQEHREEFSKSCTSGTLLDIFKFIKDKYNLSIGGREVEINKELSEHYKRVLQLKVFNKDMIINQFTIGKTAHNIHNDLPYIPGSSLKGSLRTAYLSGMCKEQDIKNIWNRYLDGSDLRSERDIYDGIRKRKVALKLEGQLLGGSFDSDPFSLVKVSDFLSVKDGRTRIVYAINKKKKRSDRPTRADSGPPQILEVIKEGSVFEGIINIQQDSRIRGAIKETGFLKQVNDFYRRLFEIEKAVIEEIGAIPIDMSGFGDCLDRSAFLIRLGRHSGAEAVTIEGNRYIKIMQKRGESDKYSDRATTIWLASDSRKPTTNNNLKPFGWAILELLPFDVKSVFPSTVVSEAPIGAIDREKVSIAPTKPVPMEFTPDVIVWEKALLLWDPGRGILTATKDHKKAEIRLQANKEMIPESLHKRLFEKKKSVIANVTVETIGNMFRIIKIDMS